MAHELDVPSGRPASVATPGPDHPSLVDLSLNQRTIVGWSVEQAVDACVRRGIPAIGLWREPVAETGLAESARLVKKGGLRVSSLCRAGFLTASSVDEARDSLASTLEAIEEAATLGAACLPIVAGGLPAGDKDIVGARRRFLEAFDQVVPVAQTRGVRLAIEPLHPMFCADRSVIVTLADAIRIADEYPSDTVGVVVDSYNVWWDPSLAESLQSAGGRIFSYQVSDWVLPLGDDPLVSRGMMGDGFVDFHHIGKMVRAAGYRGDVEVEIFHEGIWAADPESALATIMRRHAEFTHAGTSDDP